MKKVELLAPAGNYESFLGAIHAGADAVYLGGEKFGARAYADNFTEEEVCRAIRYAHVYGKKIYLTLNTLVKTREFNEIYGYLYPFYEAGLDGIIIQDLGVFKAVGEWFPGLERHVSTQMTVTGVYGASLLKDLGAARIVPARELSLAEIRKMKTEADIEIETFVHGAICYCYSGQCLFSSVIGGRSGNRGRCAQPCRLPYKISGMGGREEYPLSLKDMCTIELLPELIEAGIDSFKIEGRMKSPEYAAGVTAIYRKYIDRYYKNPQDMYEVEEKDIKMLRALYIRSEISEGYYHKHNGRDMITLENPGYAGRDEKLLEKLKQKYLEDDFRLPAIGEVRLITGEKAVFHMTCNNVAVRAEGECVQAALKQPLTVENVDKQLKKSGNTAFVMKHLSIQMSPDAFMPVKSLNDLRRKACEMLEEKMIEEHGLAYSDRKGKWEEGRQSIKDESEKVKEYGERSEKNSEAAEIHASVLTEEQFRAAIVNGVDRIYVSSDIADDTGWLEKWKEKKKETRLYLVLPYIIRMQDEMFLNKMETILHQNIFSGVLVRNLEELKWLEMIGYDKEIVSDANLYIWNPKAGEMLKEICKSSRCSFYVPYELNVHEMRELLKETGDKEFAISVYGRIPMMISANCIAKTKKNCRMQHREEKKGFDYLTDRYHKRFPVYLNCRHCYNVIYNSLPLSLHQNLEKMKNEGIHIFRLDFTNEIGNDVDRIINFFKDRLTSGNDMPPYEEYTNGHFKRGVE